MKTRRVPLTRGFAALIDERDGRLVDGRSWHVITPNGKAYAATTWRDGVGAEAPQRKAYLHQIVAEAIGAPFRHPLNGNALDCRRENFGWKESP